MDPGLTQAVGNFVATVGAALRSATGAPDAERLAVQEAFNLSTALIDADGRHTADELDALVAAFIVHGQLPGETTSDLVRRNQLVEGRKAWLATPSELYLTLRAVDQRTGSGHSRDYYRTAMTLLFTVASLDAYQSPDELEAINTYWRLLSTAAVPAAPAGPLAAAPAPAPAPAGPSPAPEPEPPAEDLDDLLAELDALIGLAEVKHQVRLLSALLRVQKLRKERNLPVVETTNHLIFSGNPGTGKTTVARLLARIYRTLGVVARGHLTEVDRAGLVVGYVGQTATRVAEVFAKADGGVLLIDEAYSLTRGGDNDFGREAIDAVVKQVEDRRATMVVILAGYPREMEELVATNPGFESRFPRTITFPDYSNDELIQILAGMGQAEGYTLGPETLAAARAFFAAQPRDHGFGNGRLARNLFESAIQHQAERLISVAQPTDEQLTTLEPADVIGPSGTAAATPG